MWRDVRFACRVLARRPLFTLLAALSLGLGIGANSAIFSLIDTLWFRPLDVPRSGAVTRVFSATERYSHGSLSYPEYLDIAAQSHTLQDLVALGGRGGRLIEGDSARLLTLNVTSPNFFTAFGVKPLLGRVYTPADTEPLLVVLGHGFWQRHFGGDPAIIGRRLRFKRINDVLITVIGVLPPSFRELETGSDRDLWFPLASWSRIGSPEELRQRGNRWFRVVGRVHPDAGLPAVDAELRTLAARMAAASPETNKDRRFRAESDLAYRAQEAGANGLALLGVVLLVVLISSVNVANLLLARAGARGAEMAIRESIGAARSRLIRQLMTENLLLGLAGLLVGLLAGAVLIQVLPWLLVQPPGFDRTLEFQFDHRVLWFSVLLSLATVVLFGLAPAWRSARPNLVPALKGEPAFSRGPGRGWPLRNWLVVAQVAVSLTLLVSAGVLLRSFMNTQTADLGFARNELLLVWIGGDPDNPSLYRDVQSRLEALPGVRGVGAAVRAPLSLSSGGMALRVNFPGRPEEEIKYNAVSRGFLATMGTPVLRGRGFEPQDEVPGANAILINERMAQRFWGQENPIGRFIPIGRARTPHQIVGVVKDAPINAIGETAEPYIYTSFWSRPESEITYLVETAGSAEGWAPAARQALKAVRADLEPLSVTTQRELVRYSAQRYQITAELVLILGALGLLLTGVGLYGVVSYGVSQRTREFGLCMALGADHTRLLARVLREVCLLALAGFALGLPLTLAVTRLMASQLFGMGPWDLASFAGGSLVLTLVLLLAGYVPARRASRLDPATALRIV